MKLEEPMIFDQIKKSIGNSIKRLGKKIILIISKEHTIREI
jgi:hypothetical protein